MKDTELFELCKEVYKRTEWDSGDLLHRLGDEVFYRELFDSDVDEKHPRESYYPLYTSDYLLAKLPRELGPTKDTLGVSWHYTEKQWTADYGYSNYPSRLAATPLKALLKLTIALHDAKELKS